MIIRLVAIVTIVLASLGCSDRSMSNLPELPMPDGDRKLLTTSSSHEAEDPFFAFLYPGAAGRDLAMELGESLVDLDWKVAKDSTVIAAGKDGEIVVMQTSDQGKDAVLSIQSAKTGMWKLDQACDLVSHCCGYLTDELEPEVYEAFSCERHVMMKGQHLCRMSHNNLRADVLAAGIQSDDPDFLTTCLPIMVNDQVAAYFRGDF